MTSPDVAANDFSSEDWGVFIFSISPAKRVSACAAFFSSRIRLSALGRSFASSARRRTLPLENSPAEVSSSSRVEPCADVTGAAAAEETEDKEEDGSGELLKWNPEEKEEEEEGEVDEHSQQKPRFQTESGVGDEGADDEEAADCSVGNAAACASSAMLEPAEGQRSEEREIDEETAGTESCVYPVRDRKPSKRKRKLFWNSVKFKNP